MDRHSENKHQKGKRALYFRNFIFGIEDSLVSTVGLLSGVAIARVEPATIFLTGMVLIFVEGFSMGVGSYLSEQSSEGYIHQTEKTSWLAVKAAVIMFFSYFFAGYIPLFPYMLFDVDKAFWLSIGFSLATLFVLGLLAARYSGIKYSKSALRMLLIGGGAIALGVIVGSLINSSRLMA